MCLLRVALRLGDTRIRARNSMINVDYCHTHLHDERYLDEMKITQVPLPTDQPYPLLSRTLTADDFVTLFAFERNPRLQQCAIVPLVQPRVFYWLQELRRPNWDHCPGESIRPTLNDPKYRTANRNATAGSPEDVWKYVWKYREIIAPPGPDDESA